MKTKKRKDSNVLPRKWFKVLSTFFGREFRNCEIQKHFPEIDTTSVNARLYRSVDIGLVKKIKYGVYSVPNVFDPDAEYEKVKAAFSTKCSTKKTSSPFHQPGIADRNRLIDLERQKILKKLANLNEFSITEAHDIAISLGLRYHDNYNKINRLIHNWVDFKWVQRVGNKKYKVKVNGYRE